MFEQRRLIVGGGQITVSDYPFMVQLYKNSDVQAYCGGSLISERYAITAAHCVETAETIFVGTNHQTIYRNENRYCSDVILATVVLHSDYETFLQGNDIALLFLEHTPNCWGNVDGPVPILLDSGDFWPKTEIAPITTGRVLGWGSVIANGVSSLNLKAVDVNLYTSHQCTHIYNTVLAESNRCAGTFPDDGSDSCSGDSGGPLVIAYNNSFVQVGIVSWGVGDPVCADGNYPGVYNTISGNEGFLKLTNATFATYDSELINLDNRDCSCTNPGTICSTINYTLTKCGCEVWNADEVAFCYIKYPHKCPSSLKSLLYNGAAWLFCSPLTSLPIITAETPELTQDHHYHHEYTEDYPMYYFSSFYLLFLFFFIGTFLSFTELFYIR